MPSPKPKKKALGRGLGSLIQEAQTETGAAIVQADSLVDIELIHPNPNQPRTHFNDVELNELSDSIAEHGVLQPLLVRKDGKGYEIIAGERRYQASKIAGLKEIPVIIKDVDDQRCLRSL